jgi:N-acetyl-anhydromuramyl-L-alanine amidase AmpD
LVRLVAYLSREYGIPSDRIIGHHDVNPQTLCPGANMDLKRLRRDVEAVKG